MQNQNTRICFIVNPAADRHRSQKHAEWLRKEASKRWKIVEIIIAQKNDSLASLAKEKSVLFDVIVACGGDGTISQVVNGIAKTNTILGVLPIGSGNDFVKSLELPKSLMECLNIIQIQHVTEIDLLRYEGDREGWCVNTIGIGLDGWTNFFAHHTSWLKGKITYYYGALKAILHFHGSEMQMESSEVTTKGKFLMITACNGKWEGGSFLVAPQADMNDGLMDILSVRKIPSLLLVVYLLLLRRGPANWMKGVEKSRTKYIDISSSTPVAVHRDGEHLGSDIRHLKISIEKNALKVIVPQRY